MANLNTTTSVVDFLKSQGKSSSFSSRAQLAVQQGIVTNANQYTGSSAQNNRLLTSLQSPTPSTPTPTETRTSAPRIDNVSDADRFINEGNQDVDEPASVRTSFQRSQDFFKEINDVITRDLGERPDAPDFAEIYNTERERLGLDTLEENIATLTAERREVEARLRQRTNAEEGKTVPLNVIQGRVDETTRQERENIDFFSREIEYQSALANNAYNAIDTIVSLTEKTYDAARTSYNDEFNQRKSMFDVAVTLEDREFDRNADLAADARANGEIIVNTAVASGKTFVDLDTATQLSLQKMGVQSGLGRNFFENMFEAAANQGKEILTHVTASDKNSVTVVYKDGSTDIISTRGGSTSGGGGGSLGGEQLSALDIGRLQELYGVTFPFGTTDNEAQNFLTNNAGLSPIEMQDVLDSGGIDIAGGSTAVPVTTDSFELSRGYFVDNFSEDQLKSLADQTGNSSIFTGKQRDIDRFLDDYMGRIQLLRDEGYTDYEIASVLEEQLGVTI
jgi:hypothetical protein